ncbi:MAG: trehalose-phosphatase [Dehalococcoidia bacterium]
MAIPVHEPSLLAPALRRPFGLFLNLNGTLAPIADRPEAAQVPPVARAAIAALVGRLDLVAVITGAPAAQAREMVGVDGVVYLGNHGQDRIGPNGDQNLAPPPSDALLAAAAAATRRCGDRGVFVEPKGAGVGIHFRAARNPRATRKHLLAALHAGEQAGQFRLVEGRCLLDLRPTHERDKGDAVTGLIDEYQLRGAIYLGDDRTDVPAFRALKRLRNAGGFGIAIGVSNDEAPEAARDYADFMVDDVSGVVRILGWLADRLPKRP